MPHEIYENDNLAYTGQTPWHGVGKRLDPNATLDEWKVQAGFNYEVLTKSVAFLDHNEQPHVVPERKMMFRDDTSEWLEVVSDQYVVHQPGEIIEFYRDLTERDGFKLEVAGSMRNGRRIWALAKSPDDFNVYDDKIKEYVLLSTDFTGSGSTIASDTAIRVVCNNTFQASLRDIGRKGVRITHRAEFDAKKVQVELGLRPDSRKALQDALKALMDTPVSNTEKASFVMAMTHPKADEDKKMELAKKPSKSMVRLFDTLQNGVGQSGIKDTMYGLFNGMTRYQDHEKHERATGSRLESAWFGPGATAKLDSWDWVVNQCVRRHNVQPELLGVRA